MSEIKYDTEALETSANAIRGIMQANIDHKALLEIKEPEGIEEFGVSIDIPSMSELSGEIVDIYTAINALADNIAAGCSRVYVAERESGGSIAKLLRNIGKSGSDFLRKKAKEKESSEESTEESGGGYYPGSSGGSYYSADIYRSESSNSSAVNEDKEEDKDKEENKEETKFVPLLVKMKTGDTETEMEMQVSEGSEESWNGFFNGVNEQGLQVKLVKEGEDYTFNSEDGNVFILGNDCINVKTNFNYEERRKLFTDEEWDALSDEEKFYIVNHDSEFIKQAESNGLAWEGTIEGEVTTITISKGSLQAEEVDVATTGKNKMETLEKVRNGRQMVALKENQESLLGKENEQIKEEFYQKLSEEEEFKDILSSKDEEELFITNNVDEMTGKKGNFTEEEWNNLSNDEKAYALNYDNKAVLWAEEKGMQWKSTLSEDGKTTKTVFFFGSSSKPEIDNNEEI